MDTSNKPEEDSAEILLAHPQIVLDFIMGRLRIPYKRILPDLWLAIITEILDSLKPQLKYLSGFEEISKALNYHARDYDCRQTSDGVVSGPPDFNPELRVIFLFHYPHQCEEELDPGHGVRYVLEKKVLLTKKGQLLLWEAKYERILVAGQGYRGHRSGITEEAQYSRFSWMEVNDLLDIFKIHDHAGLAILRTLMTYVDQTISLSSQRIASWEGSSSELHGINGRIG